jgi:hypothetical protein
MLKQWRELPYRIKAMIITPYTGLFVAIIVMSQKHSNWLFLELALLQVLFGFHFWVLRPSGRSDGKREYSVACPIVYVCKLPAVLGKMPRIVALCPQKDFILACEDQGRDFLVSRLEGQEPRNLRVSPRRLLIFALDSSPAVDFDSPGVGTLADYTAITEGCNVVYCEMFIPHDRHNAQWRGIRPLSLEVAWQLIHGRPAPTSAS